GGEVAVDEGRRVRARASIAPHPRWRLDRRLALVCEVAGDAAAVAELNACDEGLAGLTRGGLHRDAFDEAVAALSGAEEDLVAIGQKAAALQVFRERLTARDAGAGIGLLAPGRRHGIDR